jgi:hypothetical protein
MNETSEGAAPCLKDEKPLTATAFVGVRGLEVVA